MKIKKKPYKIIRRGIQILSFVLFSGLFVSIFYGMKELYVSLLNHSWDWNALYPQLLLVGGTLLLTVFAGRFFCGFICSFGAMGDFLWFLSQKIWKKKWRISQKVDFWLKKIKYLVLILIVVGVWTLKLGDNMNSPWTIFGIYSDWRAWSSLGYWVSLGGVLLILIMVGSLFVERFFCRYFCPLGAILSVFSKLKRIKVTKEREHCGSCNLCSRNCPMGISLSEYDKVTSGDCIQCLECVENCPKKNAKTNVAPALMMAVSVCGICAMVYGGTVGTTTKGQTIATEQIVQTLPSGNYVDGTYVGSGMGFRGEIQVEVQVQNGIIEEIRVLSEREDYSYFKKAENGILESILKTQDVEVDVVSGATYSSMGLMEAVSNALEGHRMEEENLMSNEERMEEEVDLEPKEEIISAEEVENVQEEKEVSSEEVKTQDGNLKDGIFEGVGMGFRGEISVSVKVTEGKIVDVEILEEREDPSFFEIAKEAVISAILKSQKVSVDVVSGATYSSNGIMEAVSNALSVGENNISVEEKENERKDSSTLTEISSTEEDQSIREIPTSSQSGYQDGIFEGVGMGFRGEISVSVKVTEGKIVDVEILDEREDPSFFELAKQVVISSILQYQKVEVDGVSGATYSSNGIKEAVSNALNIPYEEESNVDTEHSGKNGRRKK